MSKIGSIAWAALIIAAGSNSLLNAQSLKSTIYHQEGWDNCGLKTCFAEAIGGTTTSISGTFFRPVTSSDHESYATAAAAFKKSDEFDFPHPTTRLSVENRGGTGGRDKMYALNEVPDYFRVTPRFHQDIATKGGISFDRFRIQLYDQGKLYSPKLRRFFHSKQHVKYSRSFRLDEVREMDFDRPADSGTRTGFVFRRHESDPTGYYQTVKGNASGPREFKTEGPGGGPLISNVIYSFAQVFNSTPAPNEGLLFKYTYKNSLLIDNPATFLLDSSTTAYGDYFNTSGISGFSLLDENGDDVTRLFNIHNSAGTLLFGVPEPSSLLLSLTAFACAFLRRYR